jgi:hypothetical protein
MSQDEKFALILKEIAEEWPDLSPAAKKARIDSLSIMRGHYEELDTLLGENFRSQTEADQIEILKKLLASSLAKIKVLETRTCELESEAAKSLVRQQKLESDVEKLMEAQLRNEEAKLRHDLDMLEMKMHIKMQQNKVRVHETEIESLQIGMTTLNRDHFV